MQTQMQFATAEAEATTGTPCTYCGRVSPGGNWVRDNRREALCDGAALDGRCDEENGADFGAE